MILYGSSLSPFVRKVLAVAGEKGLTLDLRPGAFGQGGAEFEEASPFGKVPALRDPGADGGRDLLLCDSSAIVAYLEAKHPQPALIPSDPIARARTIWFEEFGDAMVGGVIVTIFFNRVVAKLLGRPADPAAADAAERDGLPPLLAYLEGVIPPSGFLVEDRLTLADLAVASPLANLGYAGSAIDAGRYPRTAAWLAAVLARPSIATWIEKERAMLARRG